MWACISCVYIFCRIYNDALINQIFVRENSEKLVFSKFSFQNKFLIIFYLKFFFLKNYQTFSISSTGLQITDIFKFDRTSIYNHYLILIKECRRESRQSNAR